MTERIRLPTYPDRPIAFRSYPERWWVVHPVLGLVGRVKKCTGSYVLVWLNSESAAPLRESWRLESVVSCTARQVAALESRP